MSIRKEDSLRPKPACAKCGDALGFYEVRPEYIVINIIENHNDYGNITEQEYLAWRCRNCGYTIKTITMDKINA